MNELDFDAAGQSLLEYEGVELHEATRKAAEQALAAPDMAFVVAVCDDAETANAFAARQRRVLPLWFARQDQPGRMRIATRQEPESARRVVTIIYQPKWTPPAPRAKKKR